MSPARRQLLKLGLATLGAGGGLIWSVARSGSAIMSLPLRSALPEASKNEGWPTLFGPRHDSISREPGIVAGWTAAGPRELWRINVGTGYSSPVAMADSIYLLHRLGDEEVVEAFHIDTGESRWQQRYPTQFRCRFEYSHGPYASPVIDGDRLYTYGAEGVLHCWELRTGRVIWSRALNREYEVPEPLFGASSSPLIEGELLILNVGGTKHGAGIVAVDKHSGKTIWKSLADGAGYATAKAATIADRHYIFTLTHEHFVALDPVDGRVYWQIPFCSKLPDACNATSPLVVDDLVLVCCGPGPGSLCVRRGNLFLRPRAGGGRARKNRGSAGAAHRWSRGRSAEAHRLSFASARIRHQGYSSDLRRG